MLLKEFKKFADGKSAMIWVTWNEYYKHQDEYDSLAKEYKYIIDKVVDGKVYFKKTGVLRFLQSIIKKNKIQAQKYRARQAAMEPFNGPESQGWDKKNPCFYVKKGVNYKDIGGKKAYFMERYNYRMIIDEACKNNKLIFLEFIKRREDLFGPILQPAWDPRHVDLTKASQRTYSRVLIWELNEAYDPEAPKGWCNGHYINPVYHYKEYIICSDEIKKTLK